jgi:hypothetical protein
MTTLAEALRAAQADVEARYGPGKDGITRTAVEAVLKLQAGVVTERVTAPGWSGIRGDEPEPVVDTGAMVDLGTLVKTILETFKARKTGGGWTAYANDKTMTEWREQAGAE